MPRAKKIRIPREDINEYRVYDYSESFNLRRKLIYLLIEHSIVTPTLDAPADIIILCAVGKMRRKRAFAEEFLSEFAKKDAENISLDALSSPTEIFVRALILKLQKGGKTATTLHICNEVYRMRNSEEYSADSPDHRLIRLVRRVRKSIHNSKQRQLQKEEAPFDGV